MSRRRVRRALTVPQGAVPLFLECFCHDGDDDDDDNNDRRHDHVYHDGDDDHDDDDDEGDGSWFPFCQFLVDYLAGICCEGSGSALQPHDPWLRQKAAFLPQDHQQVCISRIDNKWVAVKPHGGTAFTEDKNRERAKAGTCHIVFPGQLYKLYMIRTL